MYKDEVLNSDYAKELEKMSYKDFTLGMEIMKKEAELKLEKLKRALAKPEISPFSEYILNQLYDKVTVEDRIVFEGRETVFEPKIARYIPALEDPINLPEIKGNSATMLRELFKNFERYNKVVKDKFERNGQVPMREDREFIEVQWGGRVPDEYRLKKIDDYHELSDEGRL